MYWAIRIKRLPPEIKHRDIVIFSKQFGPVEHIHYTPGGAECLILFHSKEVAVTASRCLSIGKESCELNWNDPGFIQIRDRCEREGNPASFSYVFAYYSRSYLSEEKYGGCIFYGEIF